MMNLQKILCGFSAFLGWVLMLLSFHAKLFWNENSIEFYNAHEAAFAYGVLFVVLGCVLIIVKNVSILKYLWFMWLGMVGIRATRMIPSVQWKSLIMNSPVVFWATIGFGGILTVVTIIRRMYRIF